MFFSINKTNTDPNWNYFQGKIEYKIQQNFRLGRALVTSHTHLEKFLELPLQKVVNEIKGGNEIHPFSAECKIQNLCYSNGRKTKKRYTKFNTCQSYRLCT